MAILFNPAGTLDVSTDPADIKDEDFQRCKNLDLSRDGRVETRKGHSKINSTAIDDDVSFIIVESGHRYCFSADNIYRDETDIG